MSNDPNWPDDVGEERFDDFLEAGPSESRPAGGGSGSKVLWILLAVAGGLFVLCCGGGVWFFSQFEMRFDQTAAAATAMTEELADIDIPEAFQPQGAMSMNFVFWSMKAAVYEAREGTGMLLIADMQFPNANAGQQQKQMEDALQQQGQDNRNLNVKSSETREFTIRGETATFVFSECVDADSGTAVRQVTGLYPGRDGQGFLMLQIDEESYDEEAVVRMIESIK